MIAIYNHPELDEYLQLKLTPITHDMNPLLLKKTYDLGFWATDCIIQIMKNRGNLDETLKLHEASIEMAENLIKEF